MFGAVVEGETYDEGRWNGLAPALLLTLILPPPVPTLREVAFVGLLVSFSSGVVYIAYDAGKACMDSGEVGTLEMSGSCGIPGIS